MRGRDASAGPRLDRIRVHPIKALDPVEPERVRISEVGGLADDRTYAIRDGAGELVNGKRTAAVHRLRADVDLGAGSVTLERPDAPGPRVFDLDSDREALADWLADYLGHDVAIEAAPGGELTDSSVLGGEAPGATLVSTATLEAVAAWFPDLDVASVRGRLRANLEVGGVEPFWEDRLAGGGRLRVGDVAFEDARPVNRCVVPTREPATGEPTPAFRERFLERREATFPAWADREAFDGYYALTVLLAPRPDHRGRSVGVGDAVEVLEPGGGGRVDPPTDE